ncbi:hypothetical protein SAMN05216276_106126 [Streptosporangium subroseum]|uniref:Uncharacterized protein n=1 Tax=Streptosporangium subroseum TaxID=106412 RepID=A0A239NL55_9ACTN|nr:hypothetical protein [Streptosporangium subroseum]SNT55322.1 hypothetical protein SAMN05216276_106126 [Streptosporangium subroseum]
MPGATLEALLQQDSHGVKAPLSRLADALGAMRRHRGPGFGKVALIDNGGISQGHSCEQVIPDRDAMTGIAEHNLQQALTFLR